MARMYLIVGLLVVACTVAVWAQPRIAATGSMWLESCTGDWIPSVPVKTLPAPPDYFHLEGPGGAILKLSSPELTAAFTVGTPGRSGWPASACQFACHGFAMSRGARCRCGPTRRCMGSAR